MCLVKGLYQERMDKSLPEIICKFIDDILDFSRSISSLGKSKIFFVRNYIKHDIVCPVAHILSNQVRLLVNKSVCSLCLNLMYTNNCPSI